MLLISIIIPVYNVEKYLSRCLDSVINQTYKNLEIILIDDCSTDNSLEICKKYKEQDNRIVVVGHERNRGASAARNTGMKTMHGEYVTFIDSDDFVHKDYVLHMYNLMTKYNCDIVQTAFFFGDANIFPQETKKEKIILKNKSSWAEGYQYKTVAWAKLYKKNVTNNTWFPDSKTIEDDATYYRFAYNSNKICISNLRLYYYYSANPNSTYRALKKINMDFIDIYEDRLKFFREKNEPYLLQKSYERFAIVLLLNYCNSRYLKITDEQNEILLSKFNEIYPNAVKGASLRQKPLLIAFKTAPNICKQIMRIIRR